MSTSPAALYPQYYNPTYTGSTVGYQTGNTPVKTAQNERAVVQSAGDQFINTDQQLANEYAAQQAGTQSYLNPIETNLASGQGGYNPSEASQIELTPEQKQNIVTGAGISAGAGNAAAVGAAERAAAATGGNPAALATFRARAAQSQAADAGQASTGASVAAQQAGATGAESVGNARMQQQGEGLNYLGNLQAQQGSQGQAEQGLAQQAYGTQTSGTNDATKTGLTAAGIPTTTDKLIGAAAGAASALLADGAPGYLDDGGQDAVVGENGMEAVIENAPKAVVKGASDPVRSHTTFMDNGTPGSGMPSWLQQLLASKPTQSQPSPQPGQPGWNKTTPYSQLGTAIGTIGRKLMQPSGGGPSGGGGFASGSSQMPASQSQAPISGPSQNAPFTMPGGLINRTGSPIDGTPSLPVGGAADYLGGAADAAGSGVADAASGVADAAAPAVEAIGEGVGALADGYLAGGKMGGGFHWSDSAPKSPQTPHMLERSGYQPLSYRAKPMLADGSVAEPQGAAVDPAAINNPEGAQANPGNGMQVGRAKVFNKPTLVHLEKADMVVPLSFRPKAKVRPSAAMPALRSKGNFRAA